MGIITNQKGEAPKWLKPTEYFGRLRVSYYRIGRSPRDLLLMSILRMEKVKKGKIKMEIKKKASFKWHLIPSPPSPFTLSHLLYTLTSACLTL
jgi:hypothetical protein